MRLRFRLTLIAAVAVAFASGLVFASGFDLTKLSWAQARTTQTARPTAATVKSLDETSQAFEAIAEHVTPAVVSIEAEQLESRRPQTRRNIPPGMEDFFRNFEQQDQQPRSGTGSGFIVTKDGYILTNNHVVANADRVTVTLLDNRRFPAKVIGRDPTTDVALIKVDGTDLPTVALGDDETMRVGQWVVAIGNPLGLDFTVTAGIVSAKGRSRLALPSPDGSPNRYAIQDFIQTDAAINPGNSGGPLVNIRGEVIGINSAIASSTGFNAGYGFAIPISLARIVMNDLREFGRVRRALLGVTIDEVSPADAKAAGLTEIRGVKIQSFEPPETSPARKAGLEVGDVVIAAAGQRVGRVAELQRVVRGFKPGEIVEIDVMRFGVKKSFKVRLTEPPAADETVASNTRGLTEPSRRDSRSYDRLGITVQPVSDEVANAANVKDEYRRGLMVTAVSPRGPSYRELLANDDIIVQALQPKRDIRSASDLEAVVKAVKGGDVLSLVVYSMRSGSTKVVNLSLDQ
jgi:serine protease Do